jgi:two-component system cell cycle sensor histidine kinase/response regulator CckA
MSMEARATGTKVPWNLALILIFLTIGTVTTGYLYYRDQRAQIEREKRNELAAIADLKINQIIRWREERMSDARFFSSNRPFTEFVKRFFATGRTTGESRQGLDQLLSPLAQNHDYGMIALLDSRLRTRFVVGRAKGDIGPCIVPLADTAFRTRQIMFSSLHTGENRGDIHLDVVVPIMNGDADKSPILGALLFRIDPYKVLYPLVQAWPTPSLTSESLLIERQGDEVVFLNELRHQKNTALSLRYPVASERLLAAIAARGGEGISEGVDYRGVEVLGSVRQIPDSPWFMVAKVDLSEIYAPLKERQWTTLLLMMGIIMTAAAGLGLVWRHQSSRFYRRQYQLELERRAILEHYDTLTRHANDIILLVDRDGTILDANDRAILAYGYTREELLALTMEEIRAPETVDLLPEQMREVEEKGGLIFETLHRGKDGRTFPVETSARVIDIEGKKFFQAIIRDISERKRNEEGLAKLNDCFLSFGPDPGFNIKRLVALCGELMEGSGALYNRLEEGVLSTAAVWKIPDDAGAGGKPEGHLCFDVIRQAKDEALTVHSLPESSYAETDPIIRRLKLQTYIGRGVRFADSVIGCLCVVYRKDYVPTKDDEKLMSIIASAIGVEEARQKEAETLRETNETLDAIIASSPLGIYDLDARGRIRKVWNRAAERMFGWSAREVRGLPIPFVPPDRQEESLGIVNRIFQGEPITGLELERQRRDGSPIDIRLFAATLRDREGRTRGAMGLVEDITERKKAESALAESEQRYKRLVESSPVAVAVHSQGKFVFVNEAGLRLIGAEKPEEIIGKPILDIVHPDYKELARARAFQNPGDEREAPPLEEKFVRLDGTLVDVEVASTPITYQGKRAVQVVARDITARKQAEEAVRKSEAQFRQVWESALDGMRLVDENGTIITVNDAYCRLMGLDREQLQGKPFNFAYQTGSGHRGEEEISVYRQQLASRTIKPRTEAELSLRTGKRILADLSNSVLEVPGQPPRVLTIFRDTTERREAEKKLRESEEKFRTLSEQSPNMIYINKRGRIVYVNNKCVELLGYSKEEFYSPQFDFMKLIVPEYVELVRESFQSHLGGRELPPYEYALVTKDGKRLEGIHTTTLIDYEGEQSILGLVTDITEQKRADEELRKLSRAVEQSPASIIITDTAGDIEYVNPKFTQVTGYHPAEVLGQNPRILKSGHTPVTEYKQLWERITSGNEWRGEFQNKKKNGELFWESASISPVRDPNGTITHFLAVKEDITERKRLEQQLWQAQKMESIGTLAAGIAHDFNNILAIILGYTSLMRRAAGDSPRVATSLEAIAMAVERGAGLVRQILTFARKTEFNLEPLDVNVVINELSRMLGETFPKTISLSLQLAESLPVISMDHSQLHQALLNLCVNARDAMRDHGSLAITSGSISGDGLAARFPQAAGNHYVVIGVSDTGVGMDEATKSRIFDPFFTTKEKGKGTGLGLAVVFGVVQAHQGFIDVESEPGKGSTFWIYLPVPVGIVAKPREEVPLEEEIPGGTETLLVVEDEEMLLELVATLLEQKGYRVMGAADGERAVEVYKRHKSEIALVITDLGLPKLDGWEVFKKVRKINPSAAVYLASGYVDRDLKQQILESGVKGFLQKPYRPEELLQTVRKALD